MKKFRLIVPSFVAVIMCALLIAGASLALFTTEATSSMTLTSAKVKLDSSLDVASTSSVNPSLTTGEKAGTVTSGAYAGDYYYEDYTNDSFYDGGSAAIVDNSVVVSGFAPGDKVKVKMTLTNTSTIDIKYRLRLVGSGNSDLLSVLKVKYAESTYVGLQSYKSNWSTWLVSEMQDPNTNIKNIFVDVIFPVEVLNGTNDAYHAQNVSFAMIVEGVQANAKVVNEEITSLIEAKAKVVTDQATVLKDSDGLAEATVPANSTTGVTSLTLNVKAKDTESSISVADDDTVKSYDVSLIDQANNKIENFSNPVEVKLYVGTGLSNVRVYHGANLISSSYDDETGIVSFSTTTFSEYSVVYGQPNTIYGFANSYVKNSTWVHEIKTKAQFKNIMSHLSAANATSPEQKYTDGKETNAHLADKDTIYLLKNDIDFGGNLWSASELVHQPTFTGKLIGNASTNTVLSNAQLINSFNVIASDWNSTGIFKNALDASFENITLDSIVINSSNGKGCGLFVAGNYSGLAPVYSLSFNNCVVNDTCIINASANTGAFVGSTRGISNVSFTDCENNANVICTSTNIGGFVGTGSTLASNSTNTLTFTDCENNGNIIGSNYVGGFTGNSTSNNRTLIGTGNVNNGNVYVSSGNTSFGFFFSGDQNYPDTWYKSSTSSFEGVNNGLLKVGTTTGGIEKTKLSENYVIKGSNNEALNAQKYAELVGEYHIVALGVDFDSNDQMIFANSVDCDKVVINVRQHGLRIDKELYWKYQGTEVDVTAENFESYKNTEGGLYIRTGTPIEGNYYKDSDFTLVEAADVFDSNAVYVINILYTNEAYGALQAETHMYIDTLQYASLDLVHANVYKVTECGYFIPDGANNPHASYDAVFNTCVLNDSLLGQEGYENGYHVVNGKAYTVVTNDSADAEQYLAICEWRNELIYEVTAYKNGEIVGTGSVSWGRGSGDTTHLTAINLG